ncbi:hypothetical protein KY385_02585 [Candidatus Parcubacteria bacterium]|nr:hypothetical protein [Candidatus Parcubacteria bacterium]
MLQAAAKVFGVQYILRAAAIVTLILGVLLIGASDMLLKWFGNEEAGNQHFAIYLGTALVGFSVMNWIYSNFNDLSVLKPAIYGNLVSLSAALVIDIVSLARGSVNSSIWLILLLHLVFLAAFAYCLKIIHRHKLS